MLGSTLQLQRTDMQQHLMAMMVNQLSLVKLEERVNQVRINMGLRILWPDHEVYDLLQHGISLTQIYRYSTALPYIIHLQSLKQLEESPINSGLYNHFALHRCHTLNHLGQNTIRTYAILTRRGFAVDQLMSTYRRDIYVITCQISQLSIQTYIWGVQIMTNSTIKTIPPKFIIKKNAVWFIQFQSVTPLQTISFYSVKRQPYYGSKNYNFDLPADARLQYSILFKNYQSYLEKIFNKDVMPIKTINTIQPTFKFPLFPSKEKPSDTQQPSSSSHRYKAQAKIQKTQPLEVNRWVVRQRWQLKQRGAASDIQKLDGILKVEGRCEDKKISMSMLLDEIQAIMDEEMAVLNNQFEDVRELLEMREWQANELIKELERIVHGQKPKPQQDHHHRILIRYYITLLLMKAFNEPLKDQIYFAILEHAPLIHNNQRADQIRDCLIHIIKPHFYLLTKDNQINLPKYQKYLGPIFVEMTLGALEHYKQEINSVCDLLLIFDSIEQSNRMDIPNGCSQNSNIFELYKRRGRACDLLMVQGFSQWIGQHYGIDSSHQKFLIVNLRSFPCPLQFSNHQNTPQKQQQSQNNPEINIHEDSLLKVKLTHSNLLKNQLIIAPIHHNNLHFNIYLYRQSNTLYLFFEKELMVNDHGKAIESYKIDIKMGVNGRVMRKDLLLNWSWGNISLGWQFDVSEINELEACHVDVELLMDKDIIFQSIFNYLREEFDTIFPKVLSGSHQNNSINNDAKSRWLRRRSSILLEHDLIQNDRYFKLDWQCFRHQLCQQCHFLTKEPHTLFQLEPQHFFTILLASPFQQQMHSLLLTLKYLSLREWPKVGGCWLSHLRIDYIQTRELLQLAMHNEYNQEMNVWLRELIELKMRRNVVNDQHVFLSQPRNINQIFNFIDSQYSEAYLQYLNHVKLQN